MALGTSLGVRFEEAFLSPESQSKSSWEFNASTIDAMATANVVNAIVVALTSATECLEVTETDLSDGIKPQRYIKGTNAFISNPASC